MGSDSPRDGGRRPPFQLVSSQQTHNPYRPYYSPLPDTAPDFPSNGRNGSTSGFKAASLPSSIITLPPNPSSRPIAPPALAAPPRVGGSTGSDTILARQARELLTDLDYSNYLSDQSPSLTEMAKRFASQAIWNFASVAGGQPFEAAKTVLQVADAEHASDATSKEKGKRQLGKLHEESENSDLDDGQSSSDEEAASSTYFESTNEQASGGRSRRKSASTPRRSKSKRDSFSRQRPGNKRSDKLPVLVPSSDTALDVLPKLWTAEPFSGFWRATQSTFFYNVFLKTLESWVRSFLSALLNIADPGPATGLGAINAGGIEVGEGGNPWVGIAVSVAASATAILVLSPMDMIKTRFLLTTGGSAPRSMFPSLRALPSLLVPPTIFPITLLYSTVPPFMSAYSPLLLRTYLGIDPILTPALYSVGTFCTQVAELFVRLPLETVLRRGQAHVWKQWDEVEKCRPSLATSSSSSARSGQKPVNTFEPVQWIVKPGLYKGTFGTMWHIVFDEGVRIRTIGGGLNATKHNHNTSSASIGGSSTVKDSYSSFSFPSSPSGDRPSSPTSSAVSSSSRPAGGSAAAAYRARKQLQQQKLARPLREREERGQGLAGLWRGWSIGFSGLVGVWGLAAIERGSGGDDGEF